MSDGEELEETLFIEVVPDTKKKKIIYKDGPARFLCERCIEWFKTPHKLTKHCIKEHKQRPMYKCNYCEMKFKLLAHWRSHGNVHVPSQKFPCGNCDKQFVNDSSLRRHVRNKVCQNTGEYREAESIKQEIYNVEEEEVEYPFDV